jgi:hypothetical protein
MEGNGFRTLGECEFGNVWFVEGEGKVVVNAYQAALYFGVDDFAQFAGMIADAKRRLGADREPTPPPPPPTNSKIRQFRPAPRDE